MYNEIKSTSLDELIERYGPLVKRIGQHLMGRMPASVQLEDLLQSGMIGLLEAARNYDTSKGASFETYAGIRIRGAMIDEVRKGDWVPRSVHRNARSIAEAIKRVESRTGRDATDQQTADELGVDLNSYHNMLQDSVGSRLFSLDDLNNGGDEGGGERIAGDATDPSMDVQRDALRAQMAVEIDALPERERMVLALYYSEELNLKEIGLVLGVSESRVSQIHSQAAARLHARLSAWSASD